MGHRWLCEAASSACTLYYRAPGDGPDAWQVGARTAHQPYPLALPAPLVPAEGDGVSRRC